MLDKAETISLDRQKNNWFDNRLTTLVIFQADITKQCQVFSDANLSNERIVFVEQIKTLEDVTETLRLGCFGGTSCKPNY